LSRRRTAPATIAVVVLGLGCAGDLGPDLDAAVRRDAAPSDAREVDALRRDAHALDAPLPDASPDAAPHAPDARPPDASLTDATPSDAPPFDADPNNPYGIRLTEVTRSLGDLIYGGRSKKDSWGLGTGAAIGDLDGDEDLDLVIARIDDPESTVRGGPSLLLLNDGSSTFSFRAQASFSALLATRRIHAVTLGDLDADGDLDVFLAAEGQDHLLENDGAANFVDVSAAAGVGGPGDDVSIGAVFADLNHDGQLDLYVLNHSAAQNPYPDDRARNRLYLHIGQGRFEDVSIASATDTNGSSHVAAVFDLEGTGDPVLLVANDRFFIDGEPVFSEPERLPGDAWYRRLSIDDEGVPGFADQAKVQGVAAGRSSMGLAIADVDGDQTPDVYVTDWGENDLYLNPRPGQPLASGSAFAAGVRTDDAGYVLVSWGARFADLDRDGALELVVVNGGVSIPTLCEASHQPDVVLRQPARGLPFVPITRSVGLPTQPTCPNPGLPVVGRGAVLGDLDGDGDDDLVVTPYLEPYRVYRNDTPRANHVLRVRLIGTVSSPDPIGATLRVTLSSGAIVSRFRYGGGDTLSSSDTPLEVGLGAEPPPFSATIEWPSGITQDLALPPLDQELAVTEPSWLSLDRRVAAEADEAPILTYRPVDRLGAPLGAKGSGRTVIAQRSDGIDVVITDRGDGTYVAPLPHPGTKRRTVVTVTVDGVLLRPRLMLRYL
jgi:hypothetical protein